MTQSINRKYAKQVLAEKQMLELSDLDKKEILEKYWYYEDESHINESIAEGDFPAIDDQLKKLVVSTTSPPDVLPEGIEPIIIDWLIFKLEKALNSYISDKLSEFGITCEVYGEVEEAELCPCCQYYAIDPGEEAKWDICPVCFWENGGDGPNHISLSEARNNFLKIGAISKRHLKFVDPDGPIKYAKMSNAGKTESIRAKN